MTKLERLQEDIGTPQVSSVKLNREPFKIYTRQEHPNTGLEVLYTEDDSKALINPNGFPWFNLRLDPLGARMRKNQHHTILESGYDHFISILEHLFEKYDDRINDITSLSTTTWKDRECWVVEFNNPDFAYVDYYVTGDENVLSIANKLKINGYMILQLNSDISAYDELLTGKTITVPTDYSARMTLIIDKQMNVPLVMKVYDEKGLYEVYEYSEININPPLRSEEFTEDYPEYGF